MHACTQDAARARERADEMQDEMQQLRQQLEEQKQQLQQQQESSTTAGMSSVYEKLCTHALLLLSSRIEDASSRDCLQLTVPQSCTQLLLCLCSCMYLQGYSLCFVSSNTSVSAH